MPFCVSQYLPWKTQTSVTHNFNVEGSSNQRPAQCFGFNVCTTHMVAHRFAVVVIANSGTCQTSVDRYFRFRALGGLWVSALCKSEVMSQSESICRHLNKQTALFLHVRRKINWHKIRQDALKWGKLNNKLCGRGSSSSSSLGLGLRYKTIRKKENYFDFECMGLQAKEKWSTKNRDITTRDTFLLLPRWRCLCRRSVRLLIEITTAAACSRLHVRFWPHSAAACW